MSCRVVLAGAACLGVLLSGGGAHPTPAAAPSAVIAQADAYAPMALTAVQAQADIALLRRALETIHPGLYRYGDKADIDAAFGRLAESARGPTTDLQLWRALAVMLAEIHCDHTKPEPSEAIDRYRQTHATHFPLRFTFIEGRMIVIANDGQAGAPPVGREIVAINGTPTPVLAETLGRAVAFDGDTTPSILAKLSDDSDLMGDDFNEYWPAFFGFPTHWAIDWTTPGAAGVSHAALAPIGFKAWKALPWPGGPFRDEFYRAIHWRIAGKTALMRIDTFVNYRNPVDATAFLGGFFKTLKAQGVDHLILDLRYNGGGSEDVSVALGRYLLPGRFTWSKPVLLKAVRYGDLPAHMESWGDPRALFAPPLDHFRRLADGWWERSPGADPDDDDESVLPQDPSPDRFTGRLTVLTGPRNGSGATRTVAQLKEKAGAVLVGEDSSGSAEGPTAGHIFLLTLPNSGLKVRIPNAWNRTNIDHFTPRLGVAADERVTPTLADFDGGVDRALEVAKGASTLPTTTLADAMAGDWTGALDYRDYGTDRRVTLPTRMHGDAAGTDVTLAFTFDDGPGKTVRDEETWVLSADGKVVAVRSGSDVERLTVVETRGEAGALTLVAEGQGVENGRPVATRTILTRRGDILSISRLTARSGEPLLLRHGYRFKRAA